MVRRPRFTLLVKVPSKDTATVVATLSRHWNGRAIHLRDIGSQSILPRVRKERFPRAIHPRGVNRNLDGSYIDIQPGKKK